MKTLGTIQNDDVISEKEWQQIKKHMYDLLPKVGYITKEHYSDDSIYVSIEKDWGLEGELELNDDGSIKKLPKPIKFQSNPINFIVKKHIKYNKIKMLMLLN